MPGQVDHLVTTGAGYDRLAAVECPHSGMFCPAGILSWEHFPGRRALGNRRATGSSVGLRFGMGQVGCRRRECLTEAGIVISGCHAANPAVSRWGKHATSPKGDVPLPIRGLSHSIYSAVGAWGGSSGEEWARQRIWRGSIECCRRVLSGMPSWPSLSRVRDQRRRQHGSQYLPPFYREIGGDHGYSGEHARFASGTQCSEDCVKDSGWKCFRFPPAAGERVGSQRWMEGAGILPKLFATIGDWSRIRHRPQACQRTPCRLLSRCRRVALPQAGAHLCISSARQWFASR